MTNQLYTKINKPSDTLTSNTEPIKDLSKSRPFMMQAQMADKTQQPDLKTSLKQAEKYGHHPNQIQPANISSNTTPVQAKIGMEQLQVIQPKFKWPKFKWPKFKLPSSKKKTTTPAVPAPVGQTAIAPAPVPDKRVNPIKEEDLKAEIDRRNKRRQLQATNVAKEIREGERPEKPPHLSQKENKVDLTAHHLLPYNYIRDSFASTVENQDLKAMQNILSFSGQASTDSSEAFRALAFQKEIKAKKQEKPQLTNEEANARREQALSERKAGVEPFKRTLLPESSKKGLDRLFKSTAWASHNVFMGPAPANRLDDPKEGLDAQYTQDGNLTKSSVIAKDIHDKGFSGINPVDFNLSLQSARNEADGTAKVIKTDDGPIFGSRPRQGGTRKYNAEAWTNVGTEKVMQSGSVHVQANQKRRNYEKWSRKNNWQKLQQLGYINQEEANRMRAAVAEKRRRKKEFFQVGKRKSK